MTLTIGLVLPSPESFPGGTACPTENSLRRPGAGNTGCEMSENSRYWIPMRPSTGRGCCRLTTAGAPPAEMGWGSSNTLPVSAIRIAEIPVKSLIINESMGVGGGRPRAWPGMVPLHRRLPAARASPTGSRSRPQPTFHSSRTPLNRWADSASEGCRYRAGSSRLRDSGPSEPGLTRAATNTGPGSPRIFGRARA